MVVVARMRFTQRLITVSMPPGVEHCKLAGYTIVKQYVRELRPKPAAKISTPVEEPDPGKVAECDWATITIDFKNGTRRKLQVFGYTLAYSHRRYYAVRPRRLSFATRRPRRSLRSPRRHR